MLAFSGSAQELFRKSLRIWRALDRRTVCRNVVFDLGMNKGEDSTFYLRKGFNVVAVEANPIISRRNAELFTSYAERGQLTILNVGIWSEEKELPFYANLDNDHWSSFDPAYGCRDGTRFEITRIPCVRVETLFKRFGTPHYMKIDVEGADRLILSDMRALTARPAFVSVEEYGVACIDDLHALGYDRFQIVPQSARLKAQYTPPIPAREGIYVPASFNGNDSGLFGHELPPDRWRSLADVRADFLSGVRGEDHVYKGPEGEWFDVHATTARVLNAGP
ncbi:FkbM family methyltransferase [Azospirillum sp. Marseille-Q6669]